MNVYPSLVLLEHVLCFKWQSSAKGLPPVLLLTTVKNWASSLTHIIHLFQSHFSKAFDSEPHERLLLKSQLYFIGGLAGLGAF